MEPTATTPDHRWACLVVTLITVIGGVIRCWGLGRLGLTHFDEGIYAMAGVWVFHPHGLSAIDPGLIPYAPPGFPILVGISYLFVGYSDTASILVSIVAGTATIPVVAWLAHRTFGPGADLASASLVALSGPHIAFSRMALTDASFLLVWLVAIGLGQRFLEKPGFTRAVAMGLAVGLTQQFKYNGWLIGAIVMATAILGLIVSPDHRRVGSWIRTFGWGLLSALVASLVVLPWYLFVEEHGGYAGLLQHQRSYLVGFGRWLPSLRTQTSQAVGLSGGSTLVLVAFGLSALIAGFARWHSRLQDRLSGADIVLLVVGLGVGATSLVLIPNAAWWFGLVLAPALVLARKDSTRLVGIWWLILSAITPLYHPYARLWLPIHAVGWLIFGGLMVNGLKAARPYLRRLGGRSKSGDPTWTRTGVVGGWVLVVALAGSIVVGARLDPSRPLPGLLGPSDSVRVAAALILARFPQESTTLRILGRPCLTFYLGQKVSIQRCAGAEDFARSGEGNVWGLYDTAIEAQWRHDQVLGNRVEVFPTYPALPTLLDIDPEASTVRRNSPKVREIPLWLIAPRPR